MLNIQAFNAIRYNAAHVGTLENVLCPPAFAIDETVQSECYRRHPCNLVRVISNREEPGDGAGELLNRIHRYVSTWMRQGVLVREVQPSLYGFEITVPDHDPLFGLFSLLDIDSLTLGAGAVNESIDLGRESDQLQQGRLLANPALLMVEDETNTLEIRLRQEIDTAPPSHASDPAGTQYQVWALDQVQFHSEIASLISGASYRLLSGGGFLEATRVHSSSGLAVMFLSNGTAVDELVGDGELSWQDQFIELAGGLIRIPQVAAGLVMHQF